jgi:5-methylcytosine-specific restriction endonuclease McrA
MDYKSERWKRKRKRILKRDKYLCQISLRYGKRVEADTVHHIYPVTQYPQYAFCDWNLISMTSEMHNRMHNRSDNSLTVEGLALLERTTPPSCKNQGE